MGKRTLLIVFLLLFVAADAWADDLGIRLGVKAGGGYNQLSAPADPQGSITLLSGSAFTGPTFHFGASAAKDVLDLGPGPLTLQLEALLVRSSGSGFQRDDQGRSREIELGTWAVQLPIMDWAGWQEGRLITRAGLGANVRLAMSSSATVRQTGLETPPQPLETAPISGVGLVLGLGLAWTSAQWLIPVDFRVVWDPFVPDTTEERFRDFVSADDTGAYGVQFTFQFLVTVGIERDFL